MISSKGCVVNPHLGGLFSNINKVITCLRIYENVYVDWSQNSIYGNCWSDLFELNDAVQEPYDVISQYPFFDMTANCVWVLYNHEEWGWRQNFHALWERLRCKFSVDRCADTAAVLVRNEALANEQLHGKSQNLDEYAVAFEKSGCTHLRVVASDDESLKWFIDRFGERVVYTSTIRRAPTRNSPEQHHNAPQTTEDAKQILIEVLHLAACDVLIHPISNMATAALYINPNLKSVYLQ
jgi:hypothetical protein